MNSFTSLLHKATQYLILSHRKTKSSSIFSKIFLFLSNKIAQQTATEAGSTNLPFAIKSYKICTLTYSTMSYSNTSLAFRLLIVEQNNFHCD